jgi:CRP-like cAMP-binding protein
LFRILHVEQPRLTENLLIQALPPEISAELERHATVFELQLAQTVFEGEDGTSIYFPLDSVISLLRNLADGNSVEVAMVGREGLASVSSLLGVPETVIEGITQGRGFVARIDAAALRDAMQRSAAARDLFYRYFASYLAGATQLAACNRLHVIVRRLAHWLLLLHDRVGTDEMSVTQEFLSRMLGSRRAGINEAVHALEESGAIEHRRNRVRVRDRKLLEAQSCECYRTIADEYERALGFAPVAKGRTAKID